MERAEVLSVLVENSSQPVTVTDTDSNILYVNDALEGASGYSQEEILGGNPNVLGSRERTDEEIEEMYKRLNEGEAVEMDGVTNQTKDGEIYVQDQELIPISIHNGTPDYFVCISELED